MAQFVLFCYISILIKNNKLMMKKVIVLSLFMLTIGVINAQENLNVRRVKTGKIVREIKPGTKIVYNLQGTGLIHVVKKARYVKSEAGIITVKPLRNSGDEISFAIKDVKMFGYRTTLSVITSVFNGFIIKPGSTFMVWNVYDGQGAAVLETAK